MKTVIHSFKILLFILLVTISFLGLGAPLSGSYTIDSSMATGGTNFQSFKAFADSINTNGISGNVLVTVAIGSGPYDEQVVINTVTGAGPSATVTLDGNGETITATTSSTDRHVLRLSNVQYFTVTNLHVVMNPASTGGFYGIHVYSTADHVTISNCQIDMPGSTSTLFGGIIASGSTTSILSSGDYHDLTITGNTITGGGYGVSVYGLASPLSTNVTISDNTIYDFSSNGVYIRETDGVVISGNKLDKRAGSNSLANAIQIAQNANINARIFDNFISYKQTNGSYRGIYLFNGSGHRVYNSVIYGFASETGEMIGIEVRTASTFPEIFYNTISIDNPNPTTGNLAGFSEELSNTGSILRDNIISITQPTTGTIAGIATGSSTSSFNSDSNDIYVPMGNIGSKGSTIGTYTTYNTLADWKNAYAGVDAHSYSINPFFESSTLVRPTNGAINDKGSHHGGVTTDILGTTRGLNPDMGAYEFTPAADDAAISGFVNTLPSCGFNTDVQFELTNAGSGTLTTLDIDWSVNGVLQSTVSWTGSLASGASTVVTLGTIAVTDTFYSFSATSSNPNGNADANPGNNTFTFNNWRVGFNGVYTINSASAASSTNYTSFQSLADALALYGVCGQVIINVDGGPYNEHVEFGTVPGTSSFNTITINGNGNTLQFDATSTSDRPDYSTLVIRGTQYLTVNNLIINGLDPSYAYGVNIIEGASHITISNCTVNIPLAINSSTQAAGISTAGSSSYLNGTLPISDDIVISGNTVNGGGNGIIMVGNFDVSQRHRNISVINNTILDQGSEAITILGVDNAVVSGNRILRPNRDNSSTFTGIYMWSGTENYVIEKNIIGDIYNSAMMTTVSAYGIRVGGNSTVSSSGVVINNVIYGWTNTSSQYGIYVSTDGPATTSLFHNTIAFNDNSFSGNASTYAIYWDGGTSADPQFLKNNIFYISRGGTGNKRLLYNSDSNGFATLMTDNNVFWFGTASGTLEFARSGSAYTSLAAWQAAGKDSNSVEKDPLFTNIAGGNLKPTEPSINDIGAAVGVTIDVLGVPRDVLNPDPGAYEFEICSTPATPASITGINSVCAGDTGVTYTIAAVSGATNYIWTIPAGATITAGQGTTSLTVNFGAQSGAVTVSAEDTCGASVPASLNVTVNGYPVVALTLPDIICNNLTAYTLTGGSPVGGTFSGNNVTAGKFNAMAAGVGDHIITYTFQNPAGCSASATDTASVQVCTGTGSLASAENNSLKIYPNPMSSSVRIELSFSEQNLNIKLFDFMGKEVRNFDQVNENFTIYRNGLAPGIYALVISGQAKILATKKLVIE